jgi:hypothetical protein
VSGPEKIADQTAGRPDSEFPTSTTPTVFADGVSGYAPGPGVIKFFLYRVDPNMFGRLGTKANPIVQVAMPFFGFAQMTALFQHGVEKLIAAGQLKQAEYDEMIKAIKEINPPPGSTNA